MFQRFKISKLPDASGNVEVFIDKTKDVRVIQTYVTLPLYSSNVVRDVNLERPDGTILGVQKAVYNTSAAIGIVFPDSFILPIYDPLLVIDTHTVHVLGAGRTITIDMIYEEVAFER